MKLREAPADVLADLTRVRAGQFYLWQRARWIEASRVGAA